MSFYQKDCHFISVEDGGGDKPAVLGGGEKPSQDEYILLGDQAKFANSVRYRTLSGGAKPRNIKVHNYIDNLCSKFSLLMMLTALR